MTILKHLSHCRTIGKASSEIRLYFAAPNIHVVSDISKHALACHGDGDINWLLANIGYTRRDSKLQTEDVNLCTYYRYSFVEYFTTTALLNTISLC